MAKPLPPAGVERLRDRLIERVFFQHYHETLNGEELLALSQVLAAQLPSGVSPDALFESLRGLAGAPLTPPLCLQTAWRLAGNTPRLVEGLPTVPWHGQEQDEWVPLEVISAAPGRNRKHEAGHYFDFRALAGTPCPMRFTAFWSDKFSRFISRRLGFSAPWAKFPYPHALALVRLRLYAHVLAARSATQPVFREIRCPPALQSWNRKHVLRTRLRVSPCPRGWTHACHRCAVGYRDCPAGTHRENYEIRACQFCGKTEAFFDPERSSERCVLCDAQERMRVPER